MSCPFLFITILVTSQEPKSDSSCTSFPVLNRINLIASLNMSQFSQIFPPCPKFTDKDIPDQIGKVFIVTGGTSGVGFEVSRILYEKNATVYIAARSEAKIHKSIREIKQRYPSSQGKLEALIIDLANLDTVQPAVEIFISREQRLDVLFNNAGVMGTKPDEKSAQVSGLSETCHKILTAYARATNCKWGRIL